MPEGTRLYLLAPIVRGRKGEYRKELADLQKRGFQRIKLDGKMVEIDAAPALDKKLKHDIEVVVDRLVVREGLGNAACRFARDRAGAGRRHRHRRERRWRRSAPSSRRSSPARSRASPFPRSSRGFFPSTTRTARARPATGSAPSSSSIPSWSCRTSGSRSRRARSRRGPIRARNGTPRRSTASRGTSRSAPTRRGRI